ncbi:MAG: hypothetical protein ACLT2Z_02605 [Eubacterium sp.]
MKWLEHGCIPAGQNNNRFRLSEPSDMVIDENNIAYIVDTGNQRIVVYDLNTEKVVKEMKKGTINLMSSRGLKHQREFSELMKVNYILRIQVPKLYLDLQRILNL